MLELGWAKQSRLSKNKSRPWGAQGLILEQFPVHFEVILGSSWTHFGVLGGLGGPLVALGGPKVSFWSHVGLILGSFWSHFEVRNR